KEAPVTTQNFLAYVREGFYEGLIFHRVIKGFMIQGGGLDASGKQKKGKSPIKLETSGATLPHSNGARDRAPTNGPNSATWQFYIRHAPQRGRDRHYAV